MGQRVEMGSARPASRPDGGGSETGDRHQHVQRTKNMSNATIFENCRPQLYALAYRMLGSVMEAEDILQEAYLRWHNLNAAAIETPCAYLTTIVTHLCIDQLRSAKMRRETYVGPWLPEPILEDYKTSRYQPETSTMLAETLSIAVMLLLERLDPVERAVFLLRQVFDFPYHDIAVMVGKSEANCRQINRRARQKVKGPQARFEVDPQQHQQLLENLLHVWQEGNKEALLAMLSHDVVVYSDGGGKVTAARKPVVGAAKVAHFLVSIIRKMGGRLRLEPRVVNGQYGAISYFDENLFHVISIEWLDGKIRRMYIVLNPEKLSHLQKRKID